MSSKRRTSYLDTSIFIETIKLDFSKGRSGVDSLIGTDRRIASSFTLIELNKMFFIISIALYEKVEELKDVGSAKIELSNKFGRDTKYFFMVDGFVERTRLDDYKDDYRKYLAMLETIIIDIQDRIHNLVHEFNGYFIKHPLAVYRIGSKLDFDELKLLAGEFNENNFRDAWTRNKSQLLSAQQYFKALAKTKKRLNAKERDLSLLLDQLLKDEKFDRGVKKYLGDLLITLEAPKNSRVLAHDRLFEEHLGKMLGKNTEYVDFKK